MALVVSIWKIEFIAPNGAVTLLLDYGDDMAQEFDHGTEQRSDDYAAIGALWGGATSDGALHSQLTWTRRKYHASPQAARGYQMMHPILMPYQKIGKLRVSINGGAVWERQKSVILSATTSIVPRVPHCTLTAYTAKIGKPILISGEIMSPGFPHEWRIVAHQSQTGTHANL